MTRREVGSGLVPFVASLLAACAAGTMSGVPSSDPGGSMEGDGGTVPGGDGGPGGGAGRADAARADAARPHDVQGGEVARGPERLVKVLHRAIDLMVGESGQVTLVDGKKVTVKLIDLQEIREPLTDALIEARLRVSVDGSEVRLTASGNHLPVTVAGVQIDCPVVQGYPRTSNGAYAYWALNKDARFRLWPAGSPLVEPGTFVYPVRQRFFAADSWISNEPILDPGNTRDAIAYHSPSDIGGAEGLTELVSAVDGQVFQSAGDNVQIRSGPWEVRYFHMKRRDVQVGDKVRMGQRIGLLGKEGGSGGWSHVHFGIWGYQPSGEAGEEMGFVFLWDTYVREYAPPLVAVAGPLHHLMVQRGGSLTLEGTQSRAMVGKIVKYEWTSTDGEPMTGETIIRTFNTVGHHSEVLKITDDQGHVDYDFIKVQVYDPAAPGKEGGWIHSTYHPTIGLEAGDPITFQVRSWTDSAGEKWDFGDGTPAVTTHSKPAPQLDPDGYAKTVHSYDKPGHYLVSVSRTVNGTKATSHLHVRVGKDGEIH